MQSLMSSLSRSDVVLVLVGMTGSGKSTFISKLTGQDVGIGHDLASCTTALGLYSYDYQDGRLYLVDTPGFDDTRRSDVEIVKELSFFLAQVYRTGARLAGILNLHRISDNRATGSAVRSFRIVDNICGPEAAKSTVLLTTMWNNLETPGPDFDAALQRENELAETEEFWGSMSREGSRIRRWVGDKASAHSIIDELIRASNSGTRITLRIQQELVERNLDFDETCVGRQLAKQYGDMWQKLRGDIEQLKKRFTEATQLRNHELAAQLLKQKTTMEQKLQATEAAEQGLRVSSVELVEENVRKYTYLLHDARRELEDNERLCQEYQNKLQELKKDLERQRRARELSEERERESRAQRQALEEREAAAKERRARKEQGDRRRRRKQEEEENLRTQQAVSEKLERGKKRRLLKRNLLPILGMLAGVGVIAAGGATLQIPIIGAGIGLLGTAASKISRGSEGKKKDNEWDVPRED